MNNENNDTAITGDGAKGKGPKVFRTARSDEVDPTQVLPGARVERGVHTSSSLGVVHAGASLPKNQPKPRERPRPPPEARRYKPGASGAAAAPAAAAATSAPGDKDSSDEDNYETDNGDELDTAEAPPSKKDHFPRKLYAMLEQAAATEHAAAASWVDDGRAFAIHDREAFLANLVPRFFKQTKFRSFTRQLNLWGFQRSSTTIVGKWEHPHFVRGNLEGLSAIERIEVKSAVGGPKTSKKRSERRKAPATSGARKAKRYTQEKALAAAAEADGADAVATLAAKGAAAAAGEKGAEGGGNDLVSGGASEKRADSSSKKKKKRKKKSASSPKPSGPANNSAKTGNAVDRSKQRKKRKVVEEVTCSLSYKEKRAKMRRGEPVWQYKVAEQQLLSDIYDGPTATPGNVSSETRLVTGQVALIQRKTLDLEREVVTLRSKAKKSGEEETKLAELTVKLARYREALAKQQRKLEELHAKNDALTQKSDEMQASNSTSNAGSSATNKGSSAPTDNMSSLSDESQASNSAPNTGRSAFTATADAPDSSLNSSDETQTSNEKENLADEFDMNAIPGGSFGTSGTEGKEDESSEEMGDDGSLTNGGGSGDIEYEDPMNVDGGRREGLIANPPRVEANGGSSLGNASLGPSLASIGGMAIAGAVSVAKGLASFGSGIFGGSASNLSDWAIHMPRDEKQDIYYYNLHNENQTLNIDLVPPGHDMVAFRFRDDSGGGSQWDVLLSDVANVNKLPVLRRALRTTWSDVPSFNFVYDGFCTNKKNERMITADRARLEGNGSIGNPFVLHVRFQTE